ncbi:MAG: hypothetical protein CMG71_07455 [Candidatus Marinimicrobia bacterium]|nr:hypothetical protein [Candidatus Neomarinimicrobiota bacterium]|tara:strand:- start:6794 stop:7477 length:684 start_codon:yes stop_codon:yes gene_type:complete
MKKISKISFILLMVLFFIATGCRKRVTATDADMSEYGWVLYAEGKFLESNEWFISAVARDTTYKDGYNGQGWTYGKLGEVDSSIVRFEKGLAKALADTTWDDQKLLFSDPSHDPAKECRAGLTLAYHAQSSYGKAIENGLKFLQSAKDETYNASTTSTPQWSFSRDEKLNSRHIIWTVSSSYFSEGKYSESQEYANKLNVIDSTFDFSTTLGIQKLAAEISRLRTTL